MHVASDSLPRRLHHSATPICQVMFLVNVHMCSGPLNVHAPAPPASTQFVRKGVSRAGQQALKELSQCRYVKVWTPVGALGLMH